MFSISVRTNARDLERQVDAFFRRQLPFAVAQGINRTATRVSEGESENIVQTFKKPSPFTRNSVGVRKARRSSPTAVVYMKDITAAYLKPYETGGVHKLAGRALFNPKDVRLNQYGQLSRGTIARLKAMPGVFVGSIKIASGETINGVWQRPFLRGRDAQIGAGLSVRQRNKLLRGKHPDLPRGANTTGRLRLPTAIVRQMKKTDYEEATAFLAGFTWQPPQSGETSASDGLTSPGSGAGVPMMSVD